MSNTTDSHSPPPHIAIFPSAGMGHLTPFLRIASMLLSHNCIVTLITARPTVSISESSHISSFLSSHPQLKHIEFQVNHSSSTPPSNADPFFLQFDAVSRSVHLLHPLLSSSSPPLSAIFSDLAVASGITQIATDLEVPNYVVCTSSVKFLCLAAYLPVLISNNVNLKTSNEVEIPGLPPVSISSVPPPFKDPNHVFTSMIANNTRSLSRVQGIIVNTFDSFEPETLASANNGRVINSLPPILPIGPLEAYDTKRENEKAWYLSWLDDQPPESVVYVGFGSRTALARDQIRELSKGLERSGYRFLWVLKTSKVDKDDKDELRDLLGDSFLERTKNTGVAVKEWVNQKEILEHPATGAFVNHCGWNSVMEAARRGVPMLAWPQHGDQKVNAEIVVKAELGIWHREWGWGGEVLVKGEEIEENIREVMENEKLRGMARKVGEEARKARGIDGSSEKMLREVLESLKMKRN
ncbi:hypothetical protein UlMin_014664 [Ulmus minor]